MWKGAPGRIGKDTRSGRIWSQSEILYKLLFWVMLNWRFIKKDSWSLLKSFEISWNSFKGAPFWGVKDPDPAQQSFSVGGSLGQNPKQKAISKNRTSRSTFLVTQLFNLLGSAVDSHNLKWQFLVSRAEMWIAMGCWFGNKKLNRVYQGQYMQYAARLNHQQHWHCLKLLLDWSSDRHVLQGWMIVVLRIHRATTIWLLRLPLWFLLLCLAFRSWLWILPFALCLFWLWGRRPIFFFRFQRKPGSIGPPGRSEYLGRRSWWSRWVWEGLFQKMVKT